MTREDLLDSRTFAVVSDIHGNALALEAAFEQIRKAGVDRALVLGDLFTYGCHPREVAALIDGTTDIEILLVSGNHDVLYPTGADNYFNMLPEFIRESVIWTRRVLEGTAVLRVMTPEVVAGPLFFAHANPFGFGDWTYLNGSSAIAAAASVLRQRGQRVGIFGHTHRRKMSIISEEGLVGDWNEASIGLDFAGAFSAAVINAGSVGQPRGVGSSILFVSATAHRLECRIEDVHYDVGAHVRAILASDMSESTKKRLASFFRQEVQ